MGLASYTPPNDGTEIKAKHLRDLWSALSAQVNGNLDGDNFANNSIAYAKLSIADGDISGDKITDDTIPTTKYENGSILPEHLLAGTGTTWDWQSWTPTLTNLSGGTINYAEYIQIGKTVFWRFKYTLAGAGVGTTVSMTLPITAASTYTADNTELMTGTLVFLDAGTASHPGVIRFFNTTTVQFRAQNAAGTYITAVDATAAIPFAFGSGDTIAASGVYEAA